MLPQKNIITIKQIMEDILDAVLDGAEDIIDELNIDDQNCFNLFTKILFVTILIIFIALFVSFIIHLF